MVSGRLKSHFPLACKSAGRNVSLISLESGAVLDQLATSPAGLFLAALALRMVLCVLYRAKLNGLFSVTTLPPSVLKILLHHPLPPTTSWCNNLAVITAIYNTIFRSRPEFPNDTLRPRRDIIHAICHPQFSMDHARGRQDRDSDPHTVPLPA
jgi:hypothetical protein